MVVIWCVRLDVAVVFSLSKTSPWLSVNSTRTVCRKWRMRVSIPSLFFSCFRWWTIPSVSRIKSEKEILMTFTRSVIHRCSSGQFSGEKRRNPKRGRASILLMKIITRLEESPRSRGMFYRFTFAETEMSNIWSNNVEEKRTDFQIVCFVLESIN